MITTDDITVCMVHFNRPTLLAKTLPSYLDFKNIFVWDNNSVPQNKTFLKAFSMKNRNVMPIWNNKNIGWPKAINNMVIMSKTDWVLITAEDMLLGKDFLKTLNELLEWKPNLEQIYLHTFDAMLFHKKTFAKFGWWDEEQPNVPNFWEDNDWYLRLHEGLGFSPGYNFPGAHITGAERDRRLKHASTKDLMERMDNISYFSNCRWKISSINFDIKEITRDKSYIMQYNKNKGETAEQYYLKKWKQVNENEEGALLNKDCTFWKRILPEKNHHPEITKEYKKKYNV